MANPKIQQILDKSHTKVTIEDSKIGKMEWVIRPIPAYDLMEHFDKFSNLPKNMDIDPDNLTPADIAMIQENILPIMLAILPACAIDPPITTDVADPRLKDKEVIHIRDLSFKVVPALFNKIVDISGLTEQAEEARKKLESPSSQKA